MPPAGQPPACAGAELPKKTDLEEGGIGEKLKLKKQVHHSTEWPCGHWWTISMVNWMSKNYSSQNVFFPSPSTHTCTRPPLCFYKSMPLPDWTLPNTILQDSDFPSSSTKTFMNSNKSIFSSYYMNPFDPWCSWQKIWYLMTYHFGVFSNYFLWLSHLSQWISLKIFASMAHILTARLLPSSQHNSGTNWYLKNCWWLVLYGSLKKKIEVFE